MQFLEPQNLISILGAVLVLAGVGGGAWLAASELRLRALRRGRMQTAGGPQPGVIRARAPNRGIGDQLLGTIRTLGQQSAVRDPAKLSVLRSRLMQAGFYNREAPVIYLGARAAALAVATLGVIMIVPLIMGGKGGMLGICVASLLAGAAILGPDQVLKVRRTKREREYGDGFPDLLDLLVASVEAGLSLDAAAWAASPSPPCWPARRSWVLTRC